MKIAITGEKGFIGTHLTNYFRHVLKYEVIELGRNYYDKLEKIESLDWLIHTACVHRHEDDNQILVLNREITDKTIKSLNKNLKCNVMHLSSIQEDLDTPYGNSKKETNLKFQEYCDLNNTQFITLKLPNIFGKYAVPYKTSFVATFCYNVQNNIESNYNQNSVKLCFVEDLLGIIGKFKAQQIPFVESRVDYIYFIINEFKNKNKLNFKDKLEFDLYQTFISYKNYKK